MSAWLSLAITLVIMAIAYLLLNRHIIARTSQQAALEEIKREVGAIITELNSTTERNIELIEDRMHALEEVIGQADRRLAVLRRELSTRESEASTYSKLGRPDAGRAARVEPRPSKHEAKPDEADKPEVPLRERVRRLYLQGVSIERIASIVGRSVGEVELIVSLEEGAP